MQSCTAWLGPTSGWTSDPPHIAPAQRRLDRHHGDRVRRYRGYPALTVFWDLRGRADGRHEGPVADPDADRPRPREVERGAEHRVGVVAPAVAEGAGRLADAVRAAQEDAAEGARAALPSRTCGSRCRRRAARAWRRSSAPAGSEAKATCCSGAAADPPGRTKIARAAAATAAVTPRRPSPRRSRRRRARAALGADRRHHPVGQRGRRGGRRVEVLRVGHRQQPRHARERAQLGAALGAALQVRLERRALLLRQTGRARRRPATRATRGSAQSS